MKIFSYSFFQQWNRTWILYTFPYWEPTTIAKAHIQTATDVNWITQTQNLKQGTSKNLQTSEKRREKRRDVFKDLSNIYDGRLFYEDC